MEHFLSIDQITKRQLNAILDSAIELRAKRNRGESCAHILSGKTLAMIFEKPSLRTRVSFEQGMLELGGNAIILDQQQIGLGKREPVKDVARVLGGMVQAIAARVFEHEKLIELSKYSSVPIINMLSDEYHPCQALADILTLIDEFGRNITARTVCFIGDGNNVAKSFAVISAKLGVNFNLVAPSGYEFDKDFITMLERTNEQEGVKFTQTRDPFEAVKNADAVVTDTFVSMGQESEKQKRLKDFEGFQVNKQLISHAPNHAIIMHCLPAYRDIEISDEVMESKQSRIFQEAHNRLHAQKGLLAQLLG